MKRSVTFYLFMLLIITLYGCGEKLNGHSEKDYEASRKKIEANLSKDEKVTLEKALRVIAGECMRLKFVEPNKYQNKSFDSIVLKMIDGRTYSSVVDKAEEILQDYNKKEADKLSHEIDSLEKRKTADVNVRKSMSSLFKIDYLSIDKVDFFNDSIPSLDVSYAYIGKQPLSGELAISYEVYKKGKPEPVVGIISTRGDGNRIWQHGEAIEDHLLLREPKESDPQKWNALKYPIKNPDLQSLGLRLDVHPVSFTLNGKHYTMPKTNDAALAAEIKEKRVELTNVKNSKGTLDELELTNNK
ncbi:DUF6694 family lipoprotein [Mucilaginibacter terrae]|uniref:DUF6694 family lipoprotein n=1 Tax=Mucilaginibacter terrae TaxID=1955052 RepID=UPI00364226FF